MSSLYTQLFNIFKDLVSKYKSTIDTPTPKEGTAEERQYTGWHKDTMIVKWRRWWDSLGDRNAWGNIEMAGGRRDQQASSSIW